MPSRLAPKGHMASRVAGNIQNLQVQAMPVDEIAFLNAATWQGHGLHGRGQHPGLGVHDQVRHAARVIGMVVRD